MNLALLFLFVVTTSFAAGPNLIENGDFSRKMENGLPANWTVVEGQKVSLESTPSGQTLRVDIVRDKGSSYGEINQTIKVKPNTLYALEGCTKSSRAGAGFFSIKLRKNRAELKRIGLPKSQTTWTTNLHEIASEEADEIQVLCRWEQNGQRGWLNQTCWFANVRLTEKGAVPPPPAWVQIIQKAAQVKPVAVPSLVIKTAGDIYVTPEGAGERNGASWKDALPGNAPGVIQAAWDALKPGTACRVGSGIYVNAALKIANGGIGPDQMKKLVGEDTGSGLPWFVGDWKPQQPDKGLAFASLQNEVDYCAFENLQLARYQFGLHSSKGRHVGLRIKNFDVYEGRHGIYLNGFAYVEEPEVASHDICIEDCEFIHFTKNAIRLQAGNYDVKIINCVADVGGRDWMKESFHICYLVAGDLPRGRFQKDEKPWAGDHDVLFINCTARNAIYSEARYWQGDGFCAEADVRNLAFINCSSYDNADGGWDVKARNVVYVNCVGLRSKMNYRLWQQAFLYNCLSAYSFKRGGSWTSAGLWTLGDIHAGHCTFHNNDAQQILADKKNESEAAVTLHNCLISLEGPNAQASQLYQGEQRIRKSASVEWRRNGAGEAQDLDPQYIAAAESKTWMGEPANAFDSRRYGTSKGFNSAISASWKNKSTEQLIQAATALLKCEKWENFAQQVEIFSNPIPRPF